MQLSNRLTFSLASLVLIIGLLVAPGFVFAKGTVAITSTGPYTVDDEIKITLSIAPTDADGTGKVDVILDTDETKWPFIEIQVGGGSAEKALYEHADVTVDTEIKGLTALNFVYTVLATDNDDDGITIVTDKVSAGTGSSAISKAGTNDAATTAITHDAVGAKLAQRVDNTAPRYAANATNPELVSDGIYVVGEKIQVKLTFTETGSWMANAGLIPFQIGGVDKFLRATGTSGPTDNHNEITFSYTVQAGDSGAAVLPIQETPPNIMDHVGIKLIGAQLLPSSSPMQLGSVSATQPKVDSVVITSTGAYKAGAPITAQVTYDIDVVVTGTPQIALMIGSTPKMATYTSTGSTATMLNFAYTVVATDTGAVSIPAGNLSLNGGTINSTDPAFPNPASLAHSVGTSAGIQTVDTTGPKAGTPSLASLTMPSYRTGDAIWADVTFDENVVVAGGAPTLSLSVGSTTRSATYDATNSTSTELSFSYILVAGDSGNAVTVPMNALTLPTGVTIKDAVGNDADLTHAASAPKTVEINPDETGPTATIGAPTLTTSGQLIFSITFSEPLGTGASGLSLSEIAVENGTVANFGGSGMAYSIEVTPVANQKVTVGFAATAVVKDAAGNSATNVPGTPVTYTPPGYVPTITIIAPTAPTTAGKLVFTLDFSDLPGAVSVASLTVTGANAPAVTDLMQATTPSTGAAVTYTLTTTPTAPTVTVSIASGAIVTYIPGVSGPIPRYFTGASAMYDENMPAMPTNLNADPGIESVVLTWTSASGKTYEYSTDNGTTWMAATSPQPVTGLTAGTAVTFSVRVKASGTIPAGHIATATATPNGHPMPAMPTNLNADPGIESVILTWTPVSGKTYEYSTDNGTTWMAATSPQSVTGLTGGTEYTFSVRVKASGTVPAGHAATKKATPQSQPIPPTTIGSSTGSVDFTAVTAAGKTTVTLTETTRLPNNGFGVLRSHNPELPDIKRFFAEGGTISVLGPSGAKKYDVVIDEIMWGLDLNAIGTARSRHQFIELYDTTGSGADLTQIEIVFDSARTVPAVPTGKVLLDQISNVSGAGWVITDAPGSDGRIPFGTNTGSANLVSMYRKIDYVKVEKTDHDADTTKNREAQLKDFPNGNALGSWAASNAVDTYGINLIGSPGSKPFKAYEPPKKSEVARTPFIINEIGNDTDSDNDWVELHNVTDSEKTLKNYQLTVVTAKGTDTELFDFHDKDWKVPGKGYVVISTRHPRDTDLAVGKDISIADDQEENKGASHLFVVKPVNLPDHGKFALILRGKDDGGGGHDKQGKDELLMDVVATREGAFAYPDQGSSLWPLKATGLPHDNVVKNGDENFAAGKVYQRNNTNADGKESIEIRGYTGVGYDRTATASAANGGTPGYENGAVKDKIMDGNTVVLDGEITFSEIMLGLGDGRQNLPQWIELYNSSMVQAVNLNGWKLHVENTADVKTALDAVLTLGTLIIQPNQTVLIVTNTGRVSDPDHFPSNRVVNLWTTKKHREALEMGRRTDQVFSTTGLYLKLTDTKNNVVDEIGNLDGNRRTRDELANTWVIPMNGEDDGRRSSLIRVYDDGVAVDGTMEEAWVLADETNLAYAISETYYGDPDDYGTPGFRGGGPLPVSLSKFRPERLKDTGEIVIRWVTESELNNAGFNILRSETRNGAYTQLNTQLIKGQGTTSERTSYEWKDTTAKPNVVYYYQIQDVSLDGKVQTLRQSRLKGNVTAAGKLTTTWGELKSQD